jgi:Protein ChrB, N-terminal
MADEQHTRDIMADEQHTRGGAWLLVTASSAGAADSLRVAIWRKLRSLGALYLHHSVCVLPARPGVQREIRRLVDRVRANGGTARVLRIAFDDLNEEAQVIAELQAARDDEYGEVLERVPAFLDELRGERDRDRATYEEVEESEADLERFRAWLAKIDRRDYFGAPRRAEAHAAVERCARALEAFESEAFARDAQPAADRPELRAVRDDA